MNNETSDEIVLRCDRFLTDLVAMIEEVEDVKRCAVNAVDLDEHVVAWSSSETAYRNSCVQARRRGLAMMDSHATFRKVTTPYYEKR